MSRSLAYPHLRGLQVGAEVPRALYVLDYSDGTRPRWTVHERQDVGAGVVRLVLVDTANGADDLFHDAEHPAALTVLTCPRFTRRTRPYVLGHGEPDEMCCMDAQGRAAAARAPELEAAA